MKIMMTGFLAASLIFSPVILTRTNPHSAPMWRVKGSVSNMPASYEAFEVKPTDSIVQTGSLQVKIW